MGIYAKDNGGKDYEPMEAGNYAAICYMMVEIGHVPNPFHRPDSPTSNEVRHECYIRWEFPGETKVFKPENGPEPFSIGKTFTLSLHEKAGLRKTLESWRGKPFTEDEAKRFDITQLLGKTCLINVVHKTRESGKTYAEVSSISPIPKGMEKPVPSNKPILLSYEDWNENVYNSLPEWLRNRIAESEEYKALGVPKGIGQEPDDDLPF